MLAKLIAQVTTNDTILIRGGNEFKIASIIKSESGLNYTIYGNLNNECKIKTLSFDYDEYVIIK